MIETEVLIVGAGPAGLSLAIELGMQGRRCLVVESHDRVGVAPRAKTTNVRTRELMRRWGIADRLAAESPFGIDSPSYVVFATRMAGRELARFENAMYCSPVRDDRFAEHGQWIPQYTVEKVLRARAMEFEGVEMQFSTTLEDFHQTADFVEAVLKEEGGGQSTVRARYLVGADGARSTVREKLGIKMEGTSPLGHFHNTIFRAPGLATKHPLGPAIMYWMVNPDVPAVIAPLDCGDLWSFGCPLLGKEDADPERLIRAALAIDDIDIEILGRDQWTAHQLIATRYREKRVFLAGDACHLHPPFGGHGMNMGIGDAADLGWKLAAILAGWGGPKLLDSYEIERRQVHRRVVDESVENNARSSRALWRDGLEDEGSHGDTTRAEAAAEILAGKRQEFDSLHIVIGYHYESSPLLVRELADQVAPPVAPIYVASARPGNRAPHAWLDSGKSFGASLYDRLLADGMTLLVTRADAREGAVEVAATAAALGVPLKVLEIDSAALHSLYGADYALIRPDAHVAWRGDSAAQACDALPIAAGRIDATTETAG